MFCKLVHKRMGSWWTLSYKLVSIGTVQLSTVKRVQCQVNDSILHSWLFCFLHINLTVDAGSQREWGISVRPLLGHRAQRWLLRGSLPRFHPWYRWAGRVEQHGQFAMHGHSVVCRGALVLEMGTGFQLNSGADFGIETVQVAYCIQKCGSLFPGRFKVYAAIRS